MIGQGDAMMKSSHVEEALTNFSAVVINNEREIFRLRFHSFVFFSCLSCLPVLVDGLDQPPRKCTSAMSAATTHYIKRLSAHEATYDSHNRLGHYPLPGPFAIR